jgi:hypothetical protein
MDKFCYMMFSLSFFYWFVYFVLKTSRTNQTGEFSFLHSPWSSQFKGLQNINCKKDFLLFMEKGRYLVQSCVDLFLQEFLHSKEGANASSLYS